MKIQELSHGSWVMTPEDEMGAMPFVMPYNKFDPYQKSFARWVNNRAVFKSCSWEEYKYNTQSTTP
jgi:hypothetical protein